MLFISTLLHKFNEDLATGLKFNLLVTISCIGKSDKFIPFLAKRGQLTQNAQVKSVELAVASKPLRLRITCALSTKTP